MHRKLWKFWYIKKKKHYPKVLKSLWISPFTISELHKSLWKIDTSTQILSPIEIVMRRWPNQWRTFFISRIISDSCIIYNNGKFIWQVMIIHKLIHFFRIQFVVTHLFELVKSKLCVRNVNEFYQQPLYTSSLMETLLDIKLNAGHQVLLSPVSLH